MATDTVTSRFLSIFDATNFNILEGNSLRVSGPVGACRYAVLSNYSDNIVENLNPNPHLCPVTAHADALLGIVTVTKTSVTGWLTKRRDVIVTLNEQDHMIVRADDLQQVAGSCGWMVTFCCCNIFVISACIFQVVAPSTANSRLDLDQA